MSLRARVARSIGRAFSVYDVDPEDEANACFSSQDPALMVSMFDAVKAEVARDGCFPLLLRRRSDYALYVLRAEAGNAPRAWLPFVLLVATLATTVYAGALFAQGHALAMGREATTPLAPPMILTGALAFALPLLAILGVHEAARHVVARRSGAKPGLPLFLPMPPPFSFMGTFGAVTPLRAPLPTRRSLALAGAAGPLVGFAASLVVSALGLTLSAPAVSPHAASLRLGEPAAFAFLRGLVGAEGSALHPLALAGWVGLFLTAIQLLPAGALSGGMLARALLARGARVASAITLAALAMLGYAYWWPWLALAAGLLLVGPVHPQPLNEVTPPGRIAWVLAAAAALALLLSLTPLPLA